jgi:glycosyltransferase involved in cell wall biosynthesis
MKIALIGQKGIPATYGGIENYVEEISTRLAQRGHQVFVYCRPHYTSLEGIYNGVILKKIYSLKTKHLDALSHTFLSSFDSLFHDFDVVNYQALGPSSLSFIPRIFGNARVVVTIHSLDWKRSKWNGLAKTVLKLTEYPSIYSPHKVTCVSNRLKDYFEEKFKKEVTTIPTGINSPITRKADKIKKFGLEKDRYILFLGRLVPEKGCHYLIDAFEKLNTEMKLFIAGRGFFSDQYVKELHSHQSERIIFGGYVEKDVLEELFSNAYLYVLPSEVEGKSQTIVQALSYGRCVLASNIPENLEVIGKWGYSFKNKDVEDLKDKLEYLINNKKLVKQEEKQRKEYACSNFSWDKTVETLEKVYLDCLNGKGK